MGWGSKVRGVEGTPSPVTKADMDAKQYVTRAEFEAFKGEFEEVEDEPWGFPGMGILSVVAIVVSVIALGINVKDWHDTREAKQRKACQKAWDGENYSTFLRECELNDDRRAVIASSLDMGDYWEDRTLFWSDRYVDLAKAACPDLWRKHKDGFGPCVTNYRSDWTEDAMDRARSRKKSGIITYYVTPGGSR